jgi:tRNA (guanine37-N1)-methyltransferase
MRIDILTLFPSMFSGPLTESIIQRAREEGLLDIEIHDLRQFGLGKYHQVDDRPYGGGAGMLFRADVMVSAIEAISSKRLAMSDERSAAKRHSFAARYPLPATRCHRIYLSPRGKRLTQTKVERLARKHEWLLLVCGHYEGIDQRIIDGGWIDEEVSIGDYVLTGGELPAMVLVDAVARQLPGVLGKDESAHEESFSASLGRKKEYPHYTRPEEFRGLKVPDILLSGDHGKIAKWRKQKAT